MLCEPTFVWEMRSLIAIRHLGLVFLVGDWGVGGMVERVDLFIWSSTLYICILLRRHITVSTLKSIHLYIHITDTRRPLVELTELLPALRADLTDQTE